MIKKIGLFIISFIVIFSVGVSLADVIYIPSDKCHMFENVEIDNYKLYILKHDFKYYGGIEKGYRHIYEPKENECLKCRGFCSGKDKIFLLDKDIIINNITAIEDIMAKALFIEDSELICRWLEECNTSNYDKISVYKVVNNGDSYEIVLDYTKQLKRKSIRKSISSVKFLFALFATIIIETIVLFVIAKLFRKKDQISNWRLFLIGVLASSITLPLLRFVLPLFVVDEKIYVSVGELTVTLIEMFIIKYGLKVSRGKAILASIVCNIASYSVGLLIF